MEEIDDDHPRYIPAKFDSIYHNGFTEENQNLKKKIAAESRRWKQNWIYLERMEHILPMRE